ncbi:nucleoside phosphorylase [Candidatus Xianfuyuplasma coldseepsis]|uniref:Uridine phosphorylase n=1 Tax=Candidatus Xianfuyuplasma coldseepsis TaxID=2782163 RepID=A0A7L7KPF9_9MOLU|nr:nucleoside phosphorylase [Xianfuyuplasma coldseepsis]QMS84671.1 nucleoside phosphorylase [Xianfuyuplasma coldseepsis]
MNKKTPITEINGLQEDGIIQAKDALKDVEKLPSHITTSVIFFDHHPHPDLLEKSTVLFNFIGASTVVPQYVYDNQIVLAFSPLGGPAAGGLIEELIAFGIKRFIACGSSGLIGDIDASNFLLVNQAIRDEGLSYHYLEPSLYVATDTNLTQHIEQELRKRQLQYIEGITWTTDAFYRETPSRMEIRQEQGAVAVEMECASMAAVCRYYQLPFAQVLYFSDIVKQQGWSGFRQDRQMIKDTINQIIIDIAIALSQEE